MSDEQKTWWYAIGEQKFGPLSGAELWALAQQNRLSPQDMVWKQGTPDWVSASSVPQLWQRAEAAMVPPPLRQPPESAPPLPGAMPAQPEPQPWTWPSSSAQPSADEARDSYTQPRRMSFGEAISTCLKKGVTFSGRASRAEYWWFYLFIVLVGMGIGLVSGLLLVAVGGGERQIDLISNLYSVVTAIPMTAAATRRLHDTGRSGWWQLIALTGIGIFVLIYWFAQKGEGVPNKYGDPV